MINEMGKKTYFEISKQNLNRRIFFIGFLFVSGIIYMGFRITIIKLQNGPDYQKQVLSRMLSQEREISPQRGTIVDINNKVLAASTLSYHIVLSPKDILALETAAKDAIYKTLSEHLNKPQDSIKKFVEVNSNSQYSVIMRNLNADKTEVLKKEGLKGVWLEESFIRNYPKGKLAAHLIGFYNKDGKGQYGIEQQYDDYLLGKPGRIFPQVQDEGVVTAEIKPAENGSTVVLTINEVIQQYVESTMTKYIKEYKPINASAIIMNPSTGEIYSMFSYPEFDPNHYNDLESELGKEGWSALKEEDKAKRLNNAWRNYNIQGAYEPGSTFKPLLVAASLDESNIDTEKEYVCDGSVTVVQGQKPIRCWKRSGHGKQTLEEVLANSCNVGMIEIGSKMSSETFLKYMNQYGFGNFSNIQLPGEETGLLHSKLGVVERATYSIGQGFTCTPIQLITAFSAVINGGYLFEPYIVSSIIDKNQDVIYQNKPNMRRQVISQETSQVVTNYLRKVVDEGTGVNAGIRGYNIGGKTGTAEKLPRGNEKYISSFVGYAPITHPQIIGLIVFDEIPEHCGAPANAFKEMMLNILPYLDIELNVDEKEENELMSEVPKAEGLDIYEASELLGTRSLKCEVIGVGKIVDEQYPKEGMRVPKNSKVKLYVKTDAPADLLVTPNLQGLTVAEARLLVGETFTVVGGGMGGIVSQVPEAGHKVEKNSRVIVKTEKD